MQESIKSTLLLTLVFLLFFSSCSEPEAPAQRVKLPAWVKKYDLYLPHSKIIGKKDKFIFKTLEELEHLENLYQKKLTSQGFSPKFRIDRNDRLLLQFYKDYELVSVEIQKLPFSENHVIRMGYSHVDPNQE